LTLNGAYISVLVLKRSQARDDGSARFISSAMEAADDAPQLRHHVNRHVADRSANLCAEVRSSLDIDEWSVCIPATNLVIEA
jgi:hypothetical protein